MKALLQERQTDMTTIDITPAETVQGRMFGAALGAAELFTIYLGDVHGLYRAIGETGPMTASELADRTGLDLRYLVE